MNIEIHGETQARIQKELDSGRYATPEEVVVAALRRLDSFNEQSPDSLNEPSPSERLRRKIAAEGVPPLVDGTELCGDFWPEVESTDEFLAFLDELRKEVDPRMRQLTEIWQ